MGSAAFIFSTIAKLYVSEIAMSVRGVGFQCSRLLKTLDCAMDIIKGQCARPERVVSLGIIWPHFYRLFQTAHCRGVIVALLGNQGQVVPGSRKIGTKMRCHDKAVIRVL